MAKAKRPSVKPTVKKRTLNPAGDMPRGAPFQEQDVKRRLGNFQTAGEHARVGGRGTGIVGQKKQKFSTDNRKK
jgi:hypothetical protein